MYATWHRSVTGPTGTFALEEGVNAVPACTTAYKKISNGENPYTIADFNTAHSSGTKYTHFVVYTIRIDTTKYPSYYVSAYLSLAGSVNQSSKAIGVNVERTHKFAYDHDLGISFIFGTFSDTPDIIDATNIRADESQDKAQFLNVSMSAGDSFVIKEFQDTKMFVKGFSKLENDVDNRKGYFFTNDEGSIVVNHDGKYDLFLNKDDGIWPDAKEVDNGDRHLYVDVSLNWWGNDSAWTAIYAYKGTIGGNGAGDAGKWFALGGIFYSDQFRTKTQEEFFTATTYAAGYTNIAVCRLKNGKDLPDDKTQWNGDEIVDNHYTTSLVSNGYQDCVFLRSTGASMGKRGDSWALSEYTYWLD